MALVPGPDGRPRCGWCAASPDYFAYHDREWGVPVVDERFTLIVRAKKG